MDDLPTFKKRVEEIYEKRMIEEINISGVIYQVNWVDETILDEGKEHWGIIDSENRLITIYNGLSEHDSKHLVLHEIAHEIFNMLGIDIEEYLIKIYIRLLFDTICRNKIFTKNVK